jgi:hypothetical protein
LRGPSEQRVLAVAALALAVLGALWAGGWAVREATDEDPTRLALAIRCLEREYGLEVVVPAGDPLADSAPGGALKTTIGGNVVVVSVWDSNDDATETIETYARLTPENLEGRAVTRGRLANLWAEPATGEQSTVLYGCES